jgi:perosamine synthetase
MKKVKWPVWPIYSKKERRIAYNVVASNQLFAAQQVKKFEMNFKKYINSKYAVALGNATQGLHLSLAALNIGEGDEVITTPFSWISSASCILMQNAVPIFVDCDESLSIDPKKLEKKISKYTKAIILVHPFGYPSNLLEIRNIARKYSLFLIEDSSHSHGMKNKNRFYGTFGDIGVFSLHQRKAISVGDGGIIVTNNKKIADKISKLRSFGHEELSYNYRMSEIAAALGTYRLKKLDLDNRVRQKNAEFLYNFFLNSDYLIPVKPLNKDKPVYHKFLFRLNTSKIAAKVETVAGQFQKFGIPIEATKIRWNLLHRHAHFNPKLIPARGLPWKNNAYKGQYMNIKGYRNLDFPIIENIVDHELLEMPINPPVSIDFLKKVCSIMSNVLENLKK